MITDADLLQINATVITGILIFLTIAPYHKSTTWRQKRQWFNLLGAVYMTLTMLLTSIFIIVFSADISDFIGNFFDNTEVGDSDYLLSAKFTFFLGLGGIMITVMLLMRMITTSEDSKISHL